MGSVAAIGEPEAVAGFALAGVQVHPAEQREVVRAAWASLPASTVLVVLSAAAAEALAGETVGRPHILVAVMGT
jgi:vacuolar-type H+-ATPase subunit F/Vma7